MPSIEKGTEMAAKREGGRDTMTATVTETGREESRDAEILKDESLATRRRAPSSQPSGRAPDKAREILERDADAGRESKGIGAGGKTLLSGHSSQRYHSNFRYGTVAPSDRPKSHSHGLLPAMTSWTPRTLSDIRQHGPLSEKTGGGGSGGSQSESRGAEVVSNDGLRACGIGCVLKHLSDGRIVIEDVTQGGGAEDAGIKAGWCLASVDDRPVHDVPIKLIRQWCWVCAATTTSSSSESARIMLRRLRGWFLRCFCCQGPAGTTTTLKLMQDSQRSADVEPQRMVSGSGGQISDEIHNRCTIFAPDGT